MDAKIVQILRQRAAKYTLSAGLRALLLRGQAAGIGPGAAGEAGAVRAGVRRGLE